MTMKSGQSWNLGARVFAEFDQPKSGGTSGESYTVSNIAPFPKTQYVQLVASSTYGSANQADLAIAMASLASEVRSLRKEMEDMRMSMQGPTIVYRDIGLPEAVKEISALLAEQSEMYPSDISERLRIDYDMVSDALGELRKLGRVA